MLRRALIATLLFCLCTFAGAEQSGYRFQHFNRASSGLPCDGVRVMLQDSRGYLWLGTYRGVSRYDGTRFLTYGSDYVSSLAEGVSGDVWIGTDGGVVVYHFLSDQFKHIDGECVPADRVFAIARRPDGAMLCSVRSNGLFLLSPDGESARPMPVRTAEGTPIRNIYRLCSAADGRLFAADYCNDLFELCDSLAVPLQGDFFLGDDIEGLCTDAQGLLWVASGRHGLCRVNVVSGRAEPVCPLPEGARPVSVNCDGRYVWFCTTGGLLRYHPASGKTICLSHDAADKVSLSENHVSYALTDAAGSLWVATADNGVNWSNVRGERFSNLVSTREGERLDGAHFTAFASRPDGKVWAGTANAGILLLDPATATLSRRGLPANLPSGVSALCAEDAGLWVGTQRGLYFLTPQGRVREVSDLRVVSLFRSAEGVLYVGSAIGVFTYDRASGSLEVLPGLEGVTVEEMTQAAGGTLWMASYSMGAFSYDPRSGEVKRFCTQCGNAPVSAMTTSVCQDARGALWVTGFSSEIYCFREGAFRLLESNGPGRLPQGLFFTALPDDAGHLWISTDGGLVEYDDKTSCVHVFTTQDGLYCNRFLKGGIKLPDARLVFGFRDGLVLFDPARVKSGVSAPQVAVTDLRIGGKRPHNPDAGHPDLLTEIKLRAGERNLGMDFSIPGDPDRALHNIYCRLVGYDEGWRSVGVRRSVEYFNLPHGRYDLIIGVMTDDGRVRQAHKSIRIVVLPRFFQSVPGILLIVLVAVALVAGLLTFFYRKAISSQSDRHKADERKLQDSLYHEKMDFFANVIHEIKTPLTLIRTPLQNLMMDDELPADRKDDLELISTSTDYLQKLVKELLEFISVEEHGYVLELSEVNVTDRMGFVCSTYAEAVRGRNLRLNFQHSEEEISCAVDTKAFSKIVNNLLGNALKYADSFIELELRQERESVCLYFRNDGPGIPEDRREDIFVPFVHFAPGGEGQSFGIGLPLARRLAELHGGSLVLSERQDLTEFVLTLPLRHTAGSVEPSEAETSPEDPDDIGAPVANMPLLLIVEDNPDLLGYLKRKLSPEYKVIAVNSAEKALEKLSAYQVDLLLTDLGLHSMSGIELCAKVNSTPSLAHIPIIVLSAVSSVRTKIKCMENGASMYVEKPFSLDYLMTCITSVLQKRKAAKNVYRGGSEKVSIDLPDRDEEFMRRIDKFIQDNIQDPALSNKRIEEALFVSHSSLNRRMKEIYNTTPNEYIRSLRLKLAAGMLLRGGNLISEVCYAVGFNSPSYFAKCFREKYGVLPAEYAAYVKSQENNTNQSQ